MRHSPEHFFLNIVAEPDDNDPRLKYADFLEEPPLGIDPKPELAIAMRLQCEDPLSLRSVTREALQNAIPDAQSARQLMIEHAVLQFQSAIKLLIEEGLTHQAKVLESTLQGLPQLLSEDDIVRCLDFERGVALAPFDCGWLLENTWILEYFQHIWVKNIRATNEIRNLMSRHETKHIQTLSLRGNTFGDFMWPFIEMSDHCKPVALDLSATSLTRTSFRLINQIPAPVFANLKKLDVSENQLQNVAPRNNHVTVLHAVNAYVRAHMPNLEHLSLANTQLEGPDINGEFPGSAPLFHGLKFLNLQNNHITSDDVEILLRNPNLQPDISISLANNPCLNELELEQERPLKLNQNHVHEFCFVEEYATTHFEINGQLNPTELPLLFQSHKWGDITHLTLQSSLLSYFFLPNLPKAIHTLSFVDPNEYEIHELAKSTGRNRLRGLEIVQSLKSTKTLDTFSCICAPEAFPALECLTYHCAALDSIDLLRKSPLLTQLSELHLFDCPVDQEAVDIVLQMPKLNKLTMNNTALDDDQIRRLLTCQKDWHSICIRNTAEWKDFSLLHTINLPSLQELSIGGAELDIADFQNLLSEVKAFLLQKTYPRYLKKLLIQKRVDFLMPADILQAIDRNDNPLLEVCVSSLNAD